MVDYKRWFGRESVKGKTARGKDILTIPIAEKTLVDGTKVPAKTKTIIGDKAIAKRLAYEERWKAGRTKQVDDAEKYGLDPDKNDKALGQLSKQKAAGGAKVSGVSDSTRYKIGVDKIKKSNETIAKKTGDTRTQAEKIAEMAAKRKK